MKGIDIIELLRDIDDDIAMILSSCALNSKHVSFATWTGWIRSFSGLPIRL